MLHNAPTLVPAPVPTLAQVTSMAGVDQSLQATLAATPSGGDGFNISAFLSGTRATQLDMYGQPLWRQPESF